MAGKYSRGTVKRLASEASRKMAYPESTFIAGALWAMDLLAIRDERDTEPGH